MIRLNQGPLVVRSNSTLRVQRCLIAWSLKTVREPSNKISVTKSGTTSDVTIPQGYYNFTSLKETLAQSDITISRLVDNRVSITSVNPINLKDFGTLLGFEENKSIAADTLVVSRYSASLTNKLKDISISTNLIDSTRVYSQTTSDCINSTRFFDLPIDTTQSLNGDFTDYSLDAISTPCRNFHGQEIEFYVVSGGHKHDYEIYLTISVT